MVSDRDHCLQRLISLSILRFYSIRLFFFFFVFLFSWLSRNTLPPFLFLILKFCYPIQFLPLLTPSDLSYWYFTVRFRGYSFGFAPPPLIHSVTCWPSLSYLLGTGACSPPPPFTNEIRERLVKTLFPILSYIHLHTRTSTVGDRSCRYRLFSLFPLTWRKQFEAKQNLCVFYHKKLWQASTRLTLFCVCLTFFFYLIYFHVARSCEQLQLADYFRLYSRIVLQLVAAYLRTAPILIGGLFFSSLFGPWTLPFKGQSWSQKKKKGKEKKREKNILLFFSFTRLI